MSIVLIDRGADPYFKCFESSYKIVGVSATHKAVSNANFNLFNRIAVYYEKLIKKQPNFKHENQESIVIYFDMGTDCLF